MENFTDKNPRLKHGLKLLMDEALAAQEREAAMRKVLEQIAILVSDFKPARAYNRIAPGTPTGGPNGATKIDYAQVYALYQEGHGVTEIAKLIGHPHSISHIHRILKKAKNKGTLPNGETEEDVAIPQGRSRRSPRRRRAGKAWLVPEEDKKEMLRLYLETNISGSAIAKQFHVSPAYIYMNAARAGYTKRPNPAQVNHGRIFELTEEDKKEIIRLYTETDMNVDDIAKQFHVHSSSIYNWTKKWGVKARGQGRGYTPEPSHG